MESTDNAGETPKEKLRLTPANMAKMSPALEDDGEIVPELSDIPGMQSRPRAPFEPMGVTVEYNLEKALRVLKRKWIREGLNKDLKQRRYNEKPCDRRKRKSKESYKRRRKDDSRAKRSLAVYI